MNIRVISILICFLFICSILGCSTWNKFTGTEKGAVIGGGAGAVLGNMVSPGLGGTVVGGAIGATGGGLIGHEDEKDKRK